MNLTEIAIRPGDDEYDAARSTVFATAAPALVVRPRTPGEVADCLRHATAAGLPVAVRSGGHHLLGFGTLDDGVVIDLCRLDEVTVLDGSRVRVGGGATWGHVAERLRPHGLAITSGDTRSVGVGGLTQAGGIGWMVRKHGLTIDNLVAAEVVTAAGDVVRASSTENPDLLWALRGGAGNFGVVTSFEFEAQPIRTIHFGTIGLALDDVPQLLKGWAAAMRTAPEELSTTLVLAPDFGDQPPAAMVLVGYCGDDPTAIDPLRALGTVRFDDVSEREYADVLEDGGPPPGFLPVVGNTLVESVDDAVVSAIAAAYAGGRRVAFLRSLGGAVSRVPADATAYAHRSAEALVVSSALLPPDASDEQIEAARTVWRTVGDLGVGSYAGFLGSNTEADLAALWPPATRERLVELKRAWDPANTFRRTFNIAPS